MSYAAILSAWFDPDVKGVAKLVLCALADRYDEKTGRIPPTNLSLLRRITGLTTDTLSKHLDILEGWGKVRITRGGSWGPNGYEFGPDFNLEHPDFRTDTSSLNTSKREELEDDSIRPDFRTQAIETCLSLRAEYPDDLVEEVTRLVESIVKLTNKPRRLKRLNWALEQTLEVASLPVRNKRRLAVLLKLRDKVLEPMLYRVEDERERDKMTPEEREEMRKEIRAQRIVMALADGTITDKDRAWMREYVNSWPEWKRFSPRHRAEMKAALGDGKEWERHVKAREEFERKRQPSARQALSP